MTTKRITAEQVTQCKRDCLEGEDLAMQGQARQSLEKRLLSLGGRSVCYRGSEPYAARLVERGRLFNERIRMVPGKTKECHANAADLWAHDVDGRLLVTGYAFSGDRWVAAQLGDRGRRTGGDDPPLRAVLRVGRAGRGADVLLC